MVRRVRLESPKCLDDMQREHTENGARNARKRSRDVYVNDDTNTYNMPSAGATRAVAKEVAEKDRPKTL